MQFAVIILFILIQIIFIFITSSKSELYRYKISFPESFGICPGKENIALHNFLNTSAYTINPDTERANGSIIIITKEISPILPIHMRTSIEKKIQGQWVRLPTTIETPNICNGLYSKLSTWYSITKHWITREARTCPFIPNYPYPLQNVKIKTVFDLPTKVTSGEFLATITFSQVGYISVCLTLPVELIEYDGDMDDEDDK